MIRFRSALFNLLFMLWTFGLALVTAPLLLLPVRFAGMVARLWARVSLVLLRLTCGIRYEVRNPERLPATPCIIASKHQSAWETIAFWALTDFPVFILKKELLSLPFFGWHLKKLGMVAIDRKAGAGALKQMIKDSKAALEKGYSLVIFPEGTRTAPGTRKPYQRGIVGLYRALNVPVAPVALNSGTCWSRNAFVKYPGTVTVEFLPPIAPGLDADAFMQQLESDIESAVAQLS
ncbi:MAG: 1-acyl-sn-glycerol-3-phosphate acyltransferase [Alphaproteobacteria bacterium]|nr:1-acyl-sn-glycerol-3-phosphate acyltransferase [Alphaproteobacteria bacterium]